MIVAPLGSPAAVQEASKASSLFPQPSGTSKGYSDCLTLCDRMLVRAVGARPTMLELKRGHVFQKVVEKLQQAEKAGPSSDIGSSTESMSPTELPLHAAIDETRPLYNNVVGERMHRRRVWKLPYRMPVGLPARVNDLKTVLTEASRKAITNAHFDAEYRKSIEALFNKPPSDVGERRLRAAEKECKKVGDKAGVKALPTLSENFWSEWRGDDEDDEQQQLLLCLLRLVAEETVREPSNETRP